MKELHGQTLSNEIAESDRLAAGIPGQIAAKNILFSKLWAQLKSIFGVNNWSAREYKSSPCIVVYNNAQYILDESVAPLPFSSTDFTTELASNIWLPLGGTTDLRATRIVAPLTNPANVIDIDWNNLQDFNSSNRVAISANANITFTNSTNAQFATFKVLISNLATMTFPIGSISGDTRVASRVFTPTANGNYTISVYKTSTEYEIVISTNPAI